jgi:tryptophan synthase alpha chain
MNQIDQLFAKLRSENRKALMPFITAGDPDVAFTSAVLQELVKRGASMCEVGIPYSDPIADGPVIQASYTRSLANGVKLADILAMLGETAPKLAAPVVTMVSYAIVYRHGVERYCDDARAAGVAGLIVPDLPVEESPELLKICTERELSLIQLVTPLTPRERALRICETSTGFRRADEVAAGTGGERRLAPRTDEAADLHRLRRQPAGARSAARPRGRRADRRLGDCPPHRRGERTAPRRGAQGSRRLFGGTHCGAAGRLTTKARRHEEAPRELG